MKVVIVGASAAGCFAALLLARTGHDVQIVEKDRTDLPSDIESAARCAFRSGAPQIVQPHIVMARCRGLLVEHLADVYEQLLAAGVVEAPVSTQMPPTLADTTSRPGDERLTMLMTRRSTFDWVLQRATIAQRGVTMRRGVAATGLVAVSGSPPHVTGLRTAEGNLPADLVIDTTGRRSPVDHWLQEIGAQPSARTWAECGVAYFSRHYRLRKGTAPPAPLTTRIVEPFDEFTVGIWGADNDTMQLAIVPLAADRRFKTLRHPDVFDGVLRTVPTFAKWLDVLDPISDVYPMGGVHNTLRRLVVDGVPAVKGFAAIGDSVCTTNPTLGRGLALAIVGAIDLLAAIDAHGADWESIALDADERVAEHVLPFYEDQSAIDSARLATLRHHIFGAALDEPIASSERVSFAELRAAAKFDPTAFRALWGIMGMMCRPADIYTDPLIIAHTRHALLEHDRVLPPVQPSREQVWAALSGKRSSHLANDGFS